jgi:transcriptional regulator with XRE-family HTH domain
MDHNEQMALAARLVRIRDQSGLSDNDFANALGFSRTTIHHWVNLNKAPTGNNLRKLLAAIDHWHATGELLNTKDGTLFNPVTCETYKKSVKHESADPSPESGGVDHDRTLADVHATELMRKGGNISTIVPPELSRTELVVQEFGAWARRSVLKSPKLIDNLELALRRLINEVERGRVNALKMDVAADPNDWEDNLRALVMALPAQARQRLLDWLADQTSDQTD